MFSTLFSGLTEFHNWLKTNIADLEVIVLRVLAIIHLIRHF